MDRKAYLKEIENVIQKGRFKDSWDSLFNFTSPGGSIMQSLEYSFIGAFIQSLP